MRIFLAELLLFSYTQAMDNKTKKKLKSAAHHLNPVVIVGAQGLTPAVHQEIEIALESHQLIKLRLNAENREARQALMKGILDEHHAELIQKIGSTMTIYRQSESSISPLDD
jgi:RNA-binding protein